MSSSRACRDSGFRNEDLGGEELGFWDQSWRFGRCLSGTAMNSKACAMRCMQGLYSAPGQGATALP